ncbi:uncharacterized protein fs(1)M3 [Fopius arisanus]|uniref:Uncharacterized protein fs(1)M3 n=1 Tax=Fopius arisanus TaxID=64838 RepID=A0A9R1SWE5_9HYME|nr:PREDICTED: uncharacterized protein LOC105263647 [Fopius arisanus]
MGFHGVIIIFFITVIRSIVFNDASVSLCPQTIEYIDGKLRNSKVEIAKTYVYDPDSATSVTYDIEWKSLWTQDLDYHALTIGLSNEMFVLIDSDRVILISVTLNPPELFKTPISRHGVSVHRSDTPMKFIRRITWKNTIYLLICYEINFCNIYTSPSNLEFQYQHSLAYEMSIPTDANFFIDNNNLYLVVATSFNAYPACSVIYRWTETYMDEIAKIFLKSVISVLTFNHRNARVLIFAQNDEQSPVGSQIYKLIIDGSTGHGNLEISQFLPTSRPVGMRLYSHKGCNFLLVVNETESHVFWWDGTEFLPWIPVKNIKGESLLNSVQIGNDTFLFVAQRNVLSLYKVTSMHYELLDTREFPDVIRIIDIGVWNDGKTISIVLISEISPNRYRVEPVQFLMNVIKKGDAQTKDLHHNSNATEICLTKMEEKLNKSMENVEKSRFMWEHLHSAHQSVVIDALEADVIIRSAQESITIENIDITDNTTEEIIPPTELTTLIEYLEAEISKSLNKSQYLIAINSTTRTLVLPALIITNEAIFENLNTPALETQLINNKDPNEYFHNAISITRDQVFNEILKGNNVTINNLEVESMCGISRDLWLLKNESVKIPLKPLSGPTGLQIEINIENDTVFMTSDIFIRKFETSVLNSVNVTSFMNDLFITGQNQVINCDIVFDHLLVDNLILQQLNGIATEKLLTITTDQSFNDSVSINSLEVQHIYVDRINGVDPERAARVSKENVIKGQVTANNLKIIDELILDDKCELFKKVEHMYVYDNVTIIGSVSIGRLQIQNRANINLENLAIRGNDVDRLTEKFWMKSTDQVINNRVSTFENGITIDELETEYLNDIGKNEYLYTTGENIPPRFPDIHFNHFVVNGTIFHENRTKNCIEITEDALIFNTKLFFKELNVSNILTRQYNGIPIYAIMETSSDDSVPISLPNCAAQRIIINNDTHLIHLQFQILNKRNISDLLFTDQHHNVENVKTSEFTVAEFRSSNHSTKFPRAASDFIPSAEMNIIIQGPLVIEENFYIEGFINGLNITDYFHQLSKADIQIHDSHPVFEKLNVLKDTTIPFFQNIDVDKFVKNIFSKTRDQTLTGTKTFHRVTVNNVDSDVVNGKNIDKMYFVNSSIICEGEVFFTSLSTDVDAFTVNTINTTLIQRDVSYIVSKNISQMTLTGIAHWENYDSQKNLSHIIKNSVRIGSNEIITTSIDLSQVEYVEIASLYTENSSLLEIETIIQDALLRTNNSVNKFSGMKIFMDIVELEELVVDNLQIDKLETTTVHDLNSSIVRKFEDLKIINGTCTFLDEITIINLKTTHLGPGLPNISSLFTISQSADNHLPNGARFNNLVIKESAQVFSLDGVSIDKFLEDRVTLTGNHTIPSKVRFNGQIHILDNIEVETTVNGISLHDVIMKDSAELQIIEGVKSFREDLVVGDVEAPLFNRINILEAYNNGILNDDSALIKGNLVIKGDIELLQNTTVAADINGLKISSATKSFDDSSNQDFRITESNLTAINALINTTINISTQRHLSQLFYYIELEDQLETPHAKSAPKVKPVVSDNPTKFNFHAIQLKEHCPGLPSGCSCRNQYNIELSGNQFTSHKADNSMIVFNFHDMNNLFIITITTTTISSSLKCSLTPANDEFTVINWRARDNSTAIGNSTHNSEKIMGYLSDAQVFVHDGVIYIVLVISYDAEKKTHQADSLIYKLNLQKNRLKLKLKVSMYNAGAVEVFEIPEKGSHILIASEQASNSQKCAKSLLYRIKPGENVFELQRTFYSGGTRRVKSLTHRHQHFVLLDDVQTNTIHIYNYRESFDNFYLYQSLYFECGIRDIEIYYSGELGWSDAYVLITTEDSRFFLYQYMMSGKFQERMNKWIDGIISVTPLNLPDTHYLLFTMTDNSTIYRLVPQGLL